MSANREPPRAMGDPYEPKAGDHRAQQENEALEKRKSLEEILRLLDITRDIDRNQDDGNFAKNGGAIHYVFDENVFEMFIEPGRWKGRTATFYSPFWLLRRRPIDERGSWSSFSAQSALIASEYLFSGRLPGQEEPIYISEWHTLELRHRLEQMFEEFIERASKHPQRREPPPIEELPHLQEDLARIGRFAPITQEAIDRFVITRTAAHTLADDRVFEPLEQLQRLISEPLRDNIVGLHERFRPSPSDVAIIRREGDLWFEKLLEEEERRHRVNKERGRSSTMRRSRGSLRSDAATVAFVQWAASRCDRLTERVVLVTGDDLLFDAYRGWHCKISPQDPEFIQPFALRRLAQYAPLFNLSDTDSDIAGSQELFEQTRAAVEVALLPFNLAQMGAQGEKLSRINRGREFLALRRVHVVKLEEDPPIQVFAHGLSKSWLDQSSKSLNDLSLFWQQTERIAIGSMFDIIAPRLNENQIREASLAMGDGADVLRTTLTGYINGLLGNIVSNSVRLWYPLAVKFIISGVETASAMPESRVRPPIHLQFRHQQRALPDDLGSLFDFLRKGGRARQNQLMAATQDFEMQPELLFIVATILALSLHAWGEAERFAELAKHAAGVHDTYEGAVPEEAAEYLYLHALAKRFRMGALVPAKGRLALHRVREYRQSALTMLDTCLAAIPSMRDPFRAPLEAQIRARSERAALQLFYFVALQVQAAGTQGLANAEVAEGSDALAAAEADLKECVRLAEGSGKLNSTRAGDRAFPIRRQFISNIAATVAICAAFDLPQPDSGLFNEAIVIEAERLFASNSDDLPDVVELELAIFLALARGTSETNEQLRTIVAREPRSQGLLSIDRELHRRCRDWAMKFLDKRATF